ncbi:hypothetical protein PR003_g8594 [Phytophthora rubi]|uniref:Uncharacterized protein n=1 Tax=Phytophthora rubi TaxID=129364 RepID=A0A6A4FWZ8_9STRA|nr:hypothetical protein PR002_g4795 [Phytophthora rubi]KAE9046397.1 hypothetical protein PR001_g4573 [Phytophthora rubi]KAE9344178.1 hypothetical protein PR003_g8594 [Phytophthora rubi]
MPTSAACSSPLSLVTTSSANTVVRCDTSFPPVATATSWAALRAISGGHTWRG